MSIRLSAARSPILGLLVFLAVLAPPASGAEGRLLTYTHTPGDKALYDFDLKHRIQAKGDDGKPVEVSVAVTMSCLATFLGDTPDGDWGIRGDITKGTMTVRVLKGEGTDGTSDFGDIRTQYVVSPRGDIKSKKLISGSLPAIVEGAGVVTLAPDDAFLLSGVGIFPDRPLRKGDTWKGVASIQSMASSRVHQIPYESVLLGDAEFGEVPCQKIRTTSKQTIDDTIADPNSSATVRASVSESHQTTWLFDPRRSLIVSAETTVSTRTAGTLTKASGEQASITTTSSSTMKSVLREFNGQPVVTK